MMFSGTLVCISSGGGALPRTSQNSLIIWPQEGDSPHKPTVGLGVFLGGNKSDVFLGVIIFFLLLGLWE